jgi:hypothetical protein
MMHPSLSGCAGFVSVLGGPSSAPFVSSKHDQFDQCCGIGPSVLESTHTERERVSPSGCCLFCRVLALRCLVEIDLLQSNNVPNVINPLPNTSSTLRKHDIVSSSVTLFLNLFL